MSKRELIKIIKINLIAFAILGFILWFGCNYTKAFIWTMAIAMVIMVTTSCYYIAKAWDSVYDNQRKLLDDMLDYIKRGKP